MNQDDWALSVGIGHFLEKSGLVELKGAIADAKRFDEWVGSESGGGVPDKHRKLILSEPRDEDDDPTPTREEVTRWFERLHDKAMDNQRAGDGFKLGRRLWLYFSGHGASLSRERTTDTGLFTADARIRDKKFKVVNAQLFADFFTDAAAFEQVVLIMDCCRSSLKRITPHPLDWPWQNARSQATTFYAFAVSEGAAAREIDTPDGPSGLFTTKLLEVLEKPTNSALSARQLGELLDAAFDGSLRPDIFPPRLSRLDFNILEPAAPRQPAAARRLIVFDETSSQSCALASEIARDAPKGTQVIGQNELADRTDLAAFKADELVIAGDLRDQGAMKKVVDAVCPSATIVFGKNQFSDLVGHQVKYLRHEQFATSALEATRLESAFAVKQSPGARLEVTAQDRLAQVRLVSEDGRVHAENIGGLLVEDLPAGTYKIRATLGGDPWVQDVTVEGKDVVVKIPPLPLETLLPPAGGRVKGSDVAVFSQGLAAPPTVAIYAFEGTRQLAVERDASRPEDASLQSYRAALPEAGARCLLEYKSGQSVSNTVSIPVVNGWRTEVFVVAKQGAHPQVSLRLVTAASDFAAEMPTDRLRESLRVSLLQRNAPDVQFTATEVAGDPIAVLLAIALDLTHGREPAADLVDLAAALLGGADVDTSLVRRSTRVSFPPLLNAIWFAALAKNRVAIEEESPAEAMSGQLLATEPWLTWDAGDETGSADWLDDISHQIWPGWQSSPETSPTRTLEEIQVSLGTSQDALQRLSYKAPPIERLVQHDSIAFVGATNDQLLTAVAVAFALRKRKKWKRLTLWFLNDEYLSQMVSAGRQGTRLKQARDRTEADFAKLLPVVAEEFSCRRYDVFEINKKWHFASLWDWEQPGGFVHISEYLKSEDVRTADFKNMTWEIGHEPSAEYLDAVAHYEQL